MTSISKVLDASALFRHKQADQRRQAQSASSGLIDMIAKEDPDKAEDLRKKQQITEDLLQELKSRQESFKAQQEALASRRKAEARQKVEEIKQELQMLKMLAMTNPEAAARRAKQLARELKAAVSQYASASSGVGGATASLATDGAQGAAAGQDVSTSSITSFTTPEGGDVALSPQVNISLPQAGQGGESQQGSEEPNAPGATSKEETQTTFKEVAQQKFEENQKINAERKQDQEFMAEVKKAINLLKSVLETAKRAAQTMGGKEEEIDKLDKDVDAEIQSISGDLHSISSSVMTPPPAVSVNVTV